MNRTQSRSAAEAAAGSPAGDSLVVGSLVAGSLAGGNPAAAGGSHLGLGTTFGVAAKRLNDLQTSRMPPKTYLREITSLARRGSCETTSVNIPKHLYRPIL